MNMQYKHFNVQVKDVDDENSIITGVFSTADEDRHGEVVDQKSWMLDDYLQNPVILFAHDHTQPAIGKALSLNFNSEGNLEGQIQFATKEYEFANTIFKLYKGGYMRAFSVGFQNEVVEIDDEQEKVTLKKNHLFEISTVNVPANALALAKSKGIDTSPLEKHLSNTPLTPIEKEGRVLSAKNKAVIVNAVEALQQVLEADNGKSNDTAVAPKKVETPSSKGVQKSKAKLINQAIRALLAEKRNLTN
jgi:HK97 family phage prohead protease